MMRWIAVSALAGMLGTGVPVTAAEAPSTLVMLVRHAERAPGSGDVPLSEAGRARAQALAELARAAGVESIIITQFARTRQTAEPLATALGITPQVVSAQGDVARHVEAVAAAVRQLAGKTVLVVGHSNTIPAIVAALGGHRYPDLCEAEYDKLFTLVIDVEGMTRTIRSRFGAPTPSGDNCTPMR